MRSILLAGLLFASQCFAIDANDVAQYIAGRSTEATSSIQNVIWDRYASEIREKRRELQRVRLAAIDTWRLTALAPDRCPGDTLVYPFSGPDFFNAYALFSDCNDFIMMGLEPIGSIPPIDKMTTAQLATFLVDMKVVTADLFERNYFITGRMKPQMQTPHMNGVLPVIMFAMALHHLEIRSVFVVSNELTIMFNEQGSSKIKSLKFYSGDATNRSMTISSPLLNACARVNRSTVLVKSASYLFAGPHFTTLRACVMQPAVLLVQDDTGVPYDVLKKDQWTVTPYGKYNRPVSDFNYGYQPDLDKLYQSVRPGALPFSFSYHWQPGESNLIVARKKK